MTYEWSRIRDGHPSVVFKSGVQNNGLESYLTLNPLQENIGTYTCRVKNSAGADISCEIEVHAKKGTYLHKDILEMKRTTLLYYVKNGPKCDLLQHQRSLYAQKFCS